ncbi:MAG: hypothetical protein PHU25_17715 [Deltaproteobacteria bacterium]|nr:hypothetical protein [Deltaproteobacteria bacterium]
MARRAELCALLGLVAAILLVFGPALFGNVLILRDFEHWTLPGRALWREAVLSGRLPEWNPYVGIGEPLLASPVQGVLYPGHLLLLLGPPWWSVPLCWLAHTILAGAGGYALSRILGCRPSAAVLGGFGWSIGGYAVSMWENGDKTLSSAWIPWVVVGVVLLAKGGRRAGPLLAGTALAIAMICLAGDPFLVGHALALGVPIACVTAVDGRGFRSGCARTAILSLVALGLGLLVAAPALLPALSFLGLTERAGGLAPSAAGMWSLHPARLLELIAPGALGVPADLARYPGAAFVAEPGLSQTPWALSIYPGVAAVILAPLAGRRRVAAALWGVAGAGLILAAGRYTPIHAAVNRVLVPLSYMRYPEKHFLLAAASLCLLGSLGAERALAGQSRVRAAAITAAIVMALGFIACPAALREPTHLGLVHFALASAVLLGALALASRRAVLSPLVPAVAAVDLFIAATLALSWENGASLDRPPPMAETISRSSRGPEPARIYRPSEAGPGFDTLPENMGQLWGVGHVPGREPARSAFFHRLWDRVAPSGSQALALLGVQWAFLPKGAALPGFERVGDGGGWQLLRGPDRPRARVVHEVEIAGDDTALERLASSEFDFRRRALVAPSPGAVALAGGGSGEDCAFESYAAERVTVRCAPATRGMLVLTEQHAPGWSAAVDGVFAPVLRANLMMRGIYLKPGAHRITLEYRTPWLGTGLCAAVAGIALCLLLALPRSRRRREGQSETSVSPKLQSETS